MEPPQPRAYSQNPECLVYISKIHNVRDIRYPGLHRTVFKHLNNLLAPPPPPPPNQLSNTNMFTQYTVSKIILECATRAEHLFSTGRSSY